MITETLDVISSELSRQTKHVIRLSYAEDNNVVNIKDGNEIIIGKVKLDLSIYECSSFVYICLNLFKKYDNFLDIVRNTYDKEYVYNINKAKIMEELNTYYYYRNNLTLVPKEKVPVEKFDWARLIEILENSTYKSK